MAIVGEIGYEEPSNTISFVTGKTYLLANDRADAIGELRTIKINKTAPDGKVNSVKARYPNTWEVTMKKSKEVKK